jgi:hypothetical protein
MTATVRTARVVNDRFWGPHFWLEIPLWQLSVTISYPLIPPQRGSTRFCRVSIDYS